MLEIKGKYNSAIVYTDNIDQETISQIIHLCNQEFIKNCNIRIMPDCHVGKGCVIGFTANLGDKVIPNLVGVDIGCGITCIELGKANFSLEHLDNIIYEYIPSGYNVHEGRIVKFPQLQKLYCYRELKNTKRIERSIGTLGGGNHFIEVNKDKNNNIYLTIHSGSRNLGKQVADYYQNIAIDLCSGKDKYYYAKDNLIIEYKKSGRKHLIQGALKKLKKEYDSLQPKYPKELCFLTDEWRNKYLHDMNICQIFASLNRETIAKIIIKKIGLNIKNFKQFHTIHNCINFNDNIIRKGSISAYKNEKVLIPINMKDGSILAVGKGNPDWNFSAPHGAGRLMSRGKAKKLININEYIDSMKGIYSTSVCLSTLDEAPMAYKPIEEILENIKDTVEIIDIIKPIYNFKAN